jgi:hypothetical protein
LALIFPLWYLLHQLSLLFFIDSIVLSLQLLFNLTFGRLALFLIGFHQIKTKRRNRPTLKSKLFIANHCSYLDVLLLQILYQPIFLAVSPEGVEQKSFWSMFYKVNPMDLNQFLKQKHKRPIILFPEGTTSNGRAILEFQPIFNQELFTFADVHCLSIKYSKFIRYSWKSFCPCYTTGSILNHFWNVCSQYAHYVEIAESIRIEPCKNPNQELQRHLSLFTKLPMVRSSLQDKVAFLEMFNKKTR